MKQEVLDWLLEADGSGVNYVAMRDLVDTDKAKLTEAAERVHRKGPIAQVLNEMNGEGFWQKPGPGYAPKYTGTVWSLILLAQLGAHISYDERIRKACEYYLDHAMTDNGQISVNGTPSQTIDCLQGNMLAAFLDLGFKDPRLDKAFEWMAMTVTGEGIAPQGDTSTPLRYYSGKVGPGFQCGANNKLPCAWGAVKVMLAFGKLPAENRPDLINRAIETGVEFLFSVDPATAAYPCGYAVKPSGNWWKFGFPVFYITDILQIVEALTSLGYGNDPRLAPALDLISGKQNENGRWLHEMDYKGKTWGDYGTKKQPGKWVTLRALRVLENAKR